MLAFAVPFFPAGHQSIVRFSDKAVRSDAYPAIRRDRAADVKADAHPHGLTGNDERSPSALMAADTVGKKALLQLVASRWIVLDEPADHLGVKKCVRGLIRPIHLNHGTRSTTLSLVR